MKKYVSYILILIIVVGIFSFATNVKAAGVCRWHKDFFHDEGQLVEPPLTEEQCNFNKPQMYWDDPSAVPPPTPVESPLGTCLYYTTGTTTDIIRIKEIPCRSKGDSYLRWKESTLAEFQAEQAARATPTPTPVPTPTPTPAPTQVDPTYHFLAPLGSEKTFNPVSENNSALGTYLNMMIKLFIGICAVLAVVMIVIGGMEYMTSGLISSKEHGKERIRNAIFGLILALGAYTLLYTINPDLLNTELKSLKNVEVVVTLVDAIPNDTGTPPGPTAGCSAGVQKTIISMFACGDILQKINNMLADSKSAGLDITGGGYRSVAQQFALRTKYCGAGNENNPNAACNPLTALPGQSNHNNGKAFDLKCGGVFIQTRDNKCFIWLQANASKFGLYNLASEPWHWSVDGR